MARRLATVGYYVMLPNLYYRSGVMELWPFPTEEAALEAARERMFELMGSLTPGLVMSDCAAMLAFADGDKAADASRVGTVGYCMSGPFAIQAAGAFPGRVRAAASIHGVSLMTDAPDSPHLVARGRDAGFYFACAQIDRWFPEEMIPKLAADLAANHVEAEVETFPGAEHGFVFPQRPAYDRASAERHWERILALFRRKLSA
jgi:carboxymethylenebutenolidase